MMAIAGLAAGWFIYHQIYQAGYNNASTLYTLKLSKQAEAYADERAAASDASNQALTAAWERERVARHRADQLSVELADEQRRMASYQHAIQGKINDAVNADGPGFTGIGPASVQLYAQALGYTSPRDHIVPGASGTVAGSAAHAGFPPVALLQHAGEYGAWCMTLRNRLSVLAHFYEGTTQ